MIRKMDADTLVQFDKEGLEENLERLDPGEDLEEDRFPSFNPEID